MAGRAVKPPRAVQLAPNTNVDDVEVSRALDEVRDAVQAQQRLNRDETLTTQDLVVGLNAIKHSLGRAFAFVSVAPTVADASFGWGIHLDNPHPDRQVLLDVVGVGQPGARIRIT